MTAKLLSDAQLRRRYLTPKFIKLNPQYKKPLLRVGAILGMKKPAPVTVARLLYLQILDAPARSELDGGRTAEHAGLMIPRGIGERMKIRIKGGYAEPPGAEYAELPCIKYVPKDERTFFDVLRVRVPKRSRPANLAGHNIGNLEYKQRNLLPLNRAACLPPARPFSTGPYGFYAKPYADYYFRVGTKIANAAPDAVINHPIMEMVFPKLKFKRKPCAMVLEAKQPFSYELDECLEIEGKETGGKATRERKMLNSLIVGAETKAERDKWIHEKQEYKSNPNRPMDHIRPIWGEMLMKRFEKNLDEIYGKTGYTMQDFAIQDIDTLGRLKDYDNFEKVSKKRYPLRKAFLLEQLRDYFE